jgi:hypothetical protein
MIEQAQKALYAAIGAPLVVGRKLMDLSGQMTDDVTARFEVWAKEGEKVTEQLRSRDVMEELSGLVDIDQLQGRVEKLRDQLEDVLESWRENFRPEVERSAPAVKAPAAKPAAKAPAKKAPAKKPAARKPAAKKPAARKPAAKKTPATKPATKNTAAAK